jgi:hypothetical protein
MILILKRDTLRPALLAGLSSFHRQKPVDSGAGFAGGDVRKSHAENEPPVGLVVNQSGQLGNPSHCLIALTSPVSGTV